MKVNRILGGTALLGVLLGASACQREATGQVVAVVNGDEITLQELNGKIGEANLPAGADRKKVQQAALDRLVELRLISQAAKEEKIDESPDFLRRRQELEQALLGQMLTQKIDKTIPVPTEAQISKYMADHPMVFAQRTLYDVDRLQFPVPADITILKVLEPLHTLDAVAEKLASINIKTVRDTAQIDSARVPKGLIEQINNMPAGEPFVLPANGAVSVNVVTGTRQVPIAGEQAHSIAVQAVHDEALRGELKKRVDKLRQGAKIEYQKGMEPPRK